MNRQVWRIILSALTASGLNAAQANATEVAARAEIEVSYELFFRKSLLSGFRVDWLFDPPLSRMILNDFDTDSNGIFDGAEVVELNKATLPTLHASGFFTRLIVGQEQPSLIAISGIKASREGGRVRYRFTLGIAGGELDVRGTEAVVYVSDPTAITTVRPAERGAAFLGPGAPSGCVISSEETYSVIPRQNGRARTLFGSAHVIRPVLAVHLACQSAGAKS